MALGGLLGWWNLVFLLPGAAGLCLGFLSTLSARGDDAGAHPAADADSEAAREADADHDPLGFGLALLGVGRVPLGFLLTVLLTTYGAIGLVTNRILPSMPALLPVSLALAASGSLLVSALLSRLLARIAPRDEMDASAFESLVGCSGTVVALLPAAEGYAQVQDQYGNVQEVRCKDVSSTPLRPGERVVIARVESGQRLCLVVKLAEEESRVVKRSAS
ncbi:MAG: DUF1449 family protein [Deltaproteobacteria bacterium]|nr:MAG: DUF1449 family protein [Deltaproteobacteria bacterium]